MLKIPEGIDSKFRYIIIAAERAKQLQNNAKPKVKIKGTKPALIAMREVEQDLIAYELVPVEQPPQQKPPQE
jgi:DNA-directed RNA polymerase subunit omega